MSIVIPMCHKRLSECLIGSWKLGGQTNDHGSQRHKHLPSDTSSLKFISGSSRKNTFCARDFCDPKMTILANNSARGRVDRSTA